MDECKFFLSLEYLYYSPMLWNAARVSGPHNGSHDRGGWLRRSDYDMPMECASVAVTFRFPAPIFFPPPSLLSHSPIYPSLLQRLLEVIHAENKLHLVFEYLDQDLKTFMDKSSKALPPACVQVRLLPLSADFIPCYCFQVATPPLPPPSPLYVSMLAHAAVRCPVSTRQRCGHTETNDAKEAYYTI